MTYTAIILAAGQGKRMAAGENKQFIHLLDKPLFIHTVSNFAEDDWCSQIVLVINPKERDRIKQLLNQHPIRKPIVLVNGGKERQESVYYGLQMIKDPNEIVFIHDGARPFVMHEQLHELAYVVKERSAGLLAVPVTDTIKQKKGNELTTLDRSTLWAAQTPQGFRKQLITYAHEKAKAENYIGTDDASLVERLGDSVAIVTGSYHNIKLTMPEDIERAETYLKDRKMY
ncbi:2-C-methyl-D-erythritol 4-phosphate cytidylyltransferase [Aquibacillus salsiterrae]|uniref:2-C-methyl-D-erythritol 4-phosphate cytidylyltransferase n=1 Tax=Aquibacillus salsiterrae TaxID=2950439 RepID=A0A9X3WDB0_9BACI|nr:2-C-methyl-D-erythritol 4-phosphate cytidylyltransferase [Aquibacillus salsiterrae]MDC3417770.1 2-C-methyl-D-erythritol 4-phosphate cytidylyltransferase [Aquibacillus salsiterrae]